jgi:hypothetical protein
MSFNLKVEGIVGSVIFKERNIIDWNEYKIKVYYDVNRLSIFYSGDYFK